MAKTKSCRPTKKSTPKLTETEVTDSEPNVASQLSKMSALILNPTSTVQAMQDASRLTEARDTPVQAFPMDDHPHFTSNSTPLLAYETAQLDHTERNSFILGHQIHPSIQTAYGNTIHNPPDCRT